MSEISDVAANVVTSNALSYEARVTRDAWMRIESQEITLPVDIREALNDLPIEVNEFVSIAIMNFAPSQRNIPYMSIMKDLSQFFPNTNMTVYRKDIVLILSSKDRKFRWTINNEAMLTEFLIQRHACLGFSNSTRKLEGLPTAYHLTKRAIVIGRALNKSAKDQRIFFYEDYSTYCMIDMCSQRFLEASYNSDLIYLMHPAIIALERYDVMHKSDLRDVLYHYLMNDRNVTNTAAELYMHRNTVINKIRTVKEILDVDLDNHALRERLVLSCQIMEYYKMVVGKSPEL